MIWLLHEEVADAIGLALAVHDGGPSGVAAPRYRFTLCLAFPLHPVDYVRYQLLFLLSLLLPIWTFADLRVYVVELSQHRVEYRNIHRKIFVRIQGYISIHVSGISFGAFYSTHIGGLARFLVSGLLAILVVLIVRVARTQMADVPLARLEVRVAAVAFEERCRLNHLGRHV